MLQVCADYVTPSCRYSPAKSQRLTFFRPKHPQTRPSFQCFPRLLITTLTAPIATVSASNSVRLPTPPLVTKRSSPSQSAPLLCPRNQDGQTYGRDIGTSQIVPLPSSFSMRCKTPPTTYIVPIPKPGASKAEWEAFDKAEGARQPRCREEGLDQFNKQHGERHGGIDDLIERADSLMLKARETWKELGRKQEEAAAERARDDDADSFDWDPYSEPDEWSDENDSGCERSDWSGRSDEEDDCESEEGSSEGEGTDEGMDSTNEDWWDDD